LSFIWQAIPLASSGGPTRSLSYLTAGSYVVRLTVTSAAGASGSADTTLTILPRIARIATTIRYVGDTVVRTVAGSYEPSPVVEVLDQFGQIMVAQNVTFSSSAGGSINGLPVLTGFSGEATAPTWQLVTGSPVLTASSGTVSARLYATISSVSTWQMRFTGDSVWRNSLYRRVALGALIPSVEYRAINAANQPLSGAGILCGGAGDIGVASGSVSPEITTLFSPPVRVANSSGRVVIAPHAAEMTGVNPAGSYNGYAITCRGQRGAESATSPWAQQMRLDIQLDFLASITIDRPDASTDALAFSYGGAWRWYRGDFNVRPIRGRAMTQAGLPAGNLKIFCGRHSGIGADVSRGFGPGGPGGTNFNGDTVVTAADGYFVLPLIRLDPTQPWDSYGECSAPSAPAVPSDFVVIGPWWGASYDGSISGPTGFVQQGESGEVNGTIVVRDILGRPLSGARVLVNGGTMLIAGGNGTLDVGGTVGFQNSRSVTHSFSVEPLGTAGGGGRWGGGMGVAVSFCWDAPPDGSPPGQKCIGS